MDYGSNQGTSFRQLKFRWRTSQRSCAIRRKPVYSEALLVQVMTWRLLSRNWLQECQIQRLMSLLEETPRMLEGDDGLLSSG